MIPGTSTHPGTFVSHRPTSVDFGHDLLCPTDRVRDRDGSGMALFQRVCDLDLEGIVAKQKFGPYVAERDDSTWFKIRNRQYSQMQGREELFDRERHREPVPGWHSCVIASEELSG